MIGLASVARSATGGLGSTTRILPLGLSYPLPSMLKLSGNNQVQTNRGRRSSAFAEWQSLANYTPSSKTEMHRSESVSRQMGNTALAKAGR